MLGTIPLSTGTVHTYFWIVW